MKIHTKYIYIFRQQNILFTVIVPFVTYWPISFPTSSEAASTLNCLYIPLTHVFELSLQIYGLQTVYGIDFHVWYHTVIFF